MMRQLSVPLLLAVTLLQGCSGDNQEIHEWIDTQAKEVKPSVQPISQPRKFQPEPYAGNGSAEPFAVAKMVSGTKLDPQGSSLIVKGEMQRRKQPLEAYPLDTMKMVGSVMMQGAPHALLKVDTLLHYVKAGDYLGQNFGKITKISETAVDLREIIQDASGEWVERISSLQLQGTGQ
jgi:type IV pilus assembly protein PilP